MSDGARSYTGKVIGDSMELTVNFRFLLNAFAIFGSLCWAYFTIEKRITALEENITTANEEIAQLVEKHIADATIERKQLEERVAFYERELNINPLSWLKKKKK